MTKDSFIDSAERILDDLSLKTIDLESDDLQEIAQVHELLKQFSEIPDLPEDWQAIVNNSMSNAEKMIFEEIPFEGVYSEIIKGTNDLIDAFVGPINVTAEYVDRISKGDIPPEITDEYKGDFNEIKNNLNTCVVIMNGLLEETDKLINAVHEGNIEIKGDEEKFTRGWQRLVTGINNLIKILKEPIMQIAEATEQVKEAGAQISLSSQGVAEGASEQASSIEEVSSSMEEMTSMTKQNADNAVQARNMSTKTKTDKVDNLISEIASASEEQSQGINQVNTAIAQMDQVTQSNASNAKESVSAAEELSAQAAQLKEIVSFFKFDRKEKETNILKKLDEASIKKLMGLLNSNSLTEQGNRETQNTTGKNS